MPEARIILACQDYDHTRGLVDGVVPVDGFDLKVMTLSPPSQIFLELHDRPRPRRPAIRGHSGFPVPRVSSFVYLDQRQCRHPGAEGSYR